MAGRPGRGDRHFVGRDHELAVIAEGCAAARAGHGSLIVVTGEAGIGKTTLCEQAAGRATDDGFVVAWGRCWADGGSPPLWPWPEVLAELGGPPAAGLLGEDRRRADLDPDRFARFTAVGELLANRAHDHAGADRDRRLPRRRHGGVAPRPLPRARPRSAPRSSC